MYACMYAWVYMEARGQLGGVAFSFHHVSQTKSLGSKTLYLASCKLFLQKGSLITTRFANPARPGDMLVSIGLSWN